MTNEFSEIDQEVVGTSVSDGQLATESIPSIEYVEDEARAREISGALAKVEFVGLDIETTGLDPFMDKIRTVQIATDNAAWVFDIIKVPVTALEAVLSGSPIKVGHNPKFDARFFSVGGVMPEPLFDTKLTDQVLHNRGYGRKLQDLAKEYMGLDLPKGLQKSDWSGKLSPEQIQYAADDALAGALLYPKLTAQAEAQGMLQILDLENRALPAVVWMENKGVAMDKPRWDALVERQRTAATEIRHHLD